MPTPMPKRLNPFECRVLDTVRRRELLRPGASVLVAFSGGPDSSALLRALVALRPEMDLAVHAAHVVHGLHDHAEAHAEHCRVVARELAVDIRVREVDVRGRAAREGLSVEHAAREERYAALADLRAATESRYIATGHSCDDRAETVLVNLLRGTGAEGLVGVPPVRGHIVRPLIERSRTEILEYLDERGMPWVADPTNAEDDALRNRVRLHLLPEMERIAERPVAASLARLADAFEWEREGIEAAGDLLLERCLLGPSGAGDELELSVDTLRSMGEGAASLALRAAARRVAGPGRAPSLAQVREVLELLASRTGGGEQKVGDCLFRRDRGKLSTFRVDSRNMGGD